MLAILLFSLMHATYALEFVCFAQRDKMIPKSQLWTLREPHRSRIKHGLAWAANTEPKETNLKILTKRTLTKGGNRRLVASRKATLKISMTRRSEPTCDH